MKKSPATELAQLMEEWRDPETTEYALDEVRGLLADLMLEHADTIISALRNLPEGRGVDRG